jgi:hypothetical protein
VQVGVARAPRISGEKYGLGVSLVRHRDAWAGSGGLHWRTGLNLKYFDTHSSGAMLALLLTGIKRQSGRPDIFGRVAIQVRGGPRAIERLAVVLQDYIRQKFARLELPVVVYIEGSRRVCRYLRYLNRPAE